MKPRLTSLIYWLPCLLLIFGACQSPETKASESVPEPEPIKEVAENTLSVGFRAKGSVLKVNKKPAGRYPQTYPCLSVTRSEEGFQMQNEGDNDFVDLAAMNWSEVLGGDIGVMEVKGEGDDEGNWRMKIGSGEKWKEYAVEKANPGKHLFLRSAVTLAAALPAAPIHIIAVETGLQICGPKGDTLFLPLEGDSTLMAVSLLNPYPKVAFGALVMAEDEKVELVLEQVCPSSAFAEDFPMPDVRNAIWKVQEGWKKKMPSYVGKKAQGTVFHDFSDPASLPTTLETSAPCRQLMYWPGELMLTGMDGNESYELGKTRIWMLWKPGEIKLYTNAVPSPS